MREKNTQSLVERFTETNATTAIIEAAKSQLEAARIASCATHSLGTAVSLLGPEKNEKLAGIASRIATESRRFEQNITALTKESLIELERIYPAPPEPTKMPPNDE